MGLDIVLGKPVKLDGRDPKELCKKIVSMDSSIDLLLYQIDESNENDIQLAEFFKDFVFDSEGEVYDIERILTERGYKFDDIDSINSEYPYRDDTFHKGSFQFFMNDGMTLTFDDVPTIWIPFRGILYKEVGYQRKGANRAFYADNMWSEKPVFKKDEIFEHWDKYFSGEGNINHGGNLQVDKNGNLSIEKDVPFGFGVEYDLSSEENRKNFKENIIDKFVEGETFVIYC